MDLLLQLIAKKKVSINDVPLMEIIEQYLDYVRQMQEDNLDISSEFLEMAARLLYIKTVSLLPVHEEAEKLVEELRGEKIDVIQFSESPEEFIAASLSPATALSVEFDGERSAEVQVSGDQLSLAIGKEGQNVRLAAKVTGYKIDIKA